ncbi:MAG: Ig-like domain-containing protein, partial [Anaerolineales bacterium]
DWGIPINPLVGPAGSQNAFVAKLNSDGVRMWHTFMGLSGSGIAVDTNGNIFVVGSSDSTWGTPVNPFAGNRDVFVAKLNSDGVQQWHTFMGSVVSDSGSGIAIDKHGNIFVVGSSDSTWGAPVNPFAGNTDAFVTKLRQDNPPSVSITSPANYSVIFGVVNVEVDASDDFGIDKLEFALDGDVKATDTDFPYSFLWNTEPVAAGQHYIKAIASDTRGQTGEDEIQVTVNKLNLVLNVSREVEKAWIIQREYGKITLNVLDWGVLSVMKFLIYRMKAGSEYQIIKEITPEEIQGNEYTFNDLYLEKNSLYTYKVIAIGWNSAPIGASGEKII